LQARFQVISFDPGGTTGVAWAAFDKNGFVDKATWQIENPDHHLEIWHTLDNFKNAEREFGRLHVHSESFEYRNDSRKGLVLISKEYIGVMRCWCLMNAKDLSEATAGEGKNYASENKLKLIGMYQEGYENRHGNEAASHLSYYVCERLKYKEPFQREWRKLLAT